MTAVVLYGPPAAGKDTVTAALCSLDPRFELLVKLKQGAGRSSGYRFVEADELDALRRQGRIVVETRRYGNVYAVDRQTLNEARQRQAVPITHIGNVADMRRLLVGTPGTSWLRVLLWTPRSECERRSRARGDTDTAARLTAWDQTAEDVLAADIHDLFDVVIRTDRTDPATAAKRIIALVGSHHGALQHEEVMTALALFPPDGNRS
ncbi:guanylate kinase [uncultured Streptomyces sp.]|uniref:guanylate kinase n=1 Tax=uncultured Streptomyces sp. TaxID=174707 RepID=UPI00261C5152|nr:guanylate kinase [uncultured Streptomyces sp.]